MSIRLNKQFVWFALLALLAVGLTIRLYDLNWDDNHHVHPDERFITMVALDTALPAQLGDALDPRHSPLNPYWDTGGQQARRFAYGSFPLYLVRAAGALVSAVATVSGALPEWLAASDY